MVVQTKEGQRTEKKVQNVRERGRRQSEGDSERERGERVRERRVGGCVE